LGKGGEAEKGRGEGEEGGRKGERGRGRCENSWMAVLKYERKIK
jgi:hypothetical protein